MKIVICLCLPLLLLLAGCANSNKVTGSDKDTAAGTQSETAATTSYVGGNNNRIVVSYNDESNEQPFITYTQNDRVVTSGASLMGWSYSDDMGTNWTYGGKVSPPKGWAVLWGYVFWGDVPGPSTVLGVATTVSAGFYVVHHEAVAERDRRREGRSA